MVMGTNKMALFNPFICCLQDMPFNKLFQGRQTIKQAIWGSLSIHGPGPGPGPPWTTWKEEERETFWIVFIAWIINHHHDSPLHDPHVSTSLKPGGKTSFHQFSWTCNLKQENYRTKPWFLSFVASFLSSGPFNTCLESSPSSKPSFGISFSSFLLRSKLVRQSLGGP